MNRDLTEKEILEIEQLKKNLQTEEALEELYKNAKLSIFDVEPEKNGNPIAIVTGGQPGSGKSGLVKLAVKRFTEAYKDYIILDVDQYRGACAGANIILEKYPEFYSDLTDGAVGKVMGRLIEDAINGGYNFIFEGTMGKSADIVDKLKNSDKNFDILAQLMAVSREESLISIIDRYIGMKNSMYFGRLTSIKAHDDRYYNFPNVAETLEDKGAIVEVYERGGLRDDLPRIIYRTNNSKNKYKSTIEALKAGRKNSLVECMKSDPKGRMERLRRQMEVLETSEGPLEQLKATEDIINGTYEIWQNYEISM